MQEFSSVTASSYDAESLAPMLSEKSQEGWSIVSIVAAGTNIVAYLSRETDTSDAQPTAAGDDAAGRADDPISTDPADAPMQESTSSSSAVEEPAGWGAVDDGPAAMANADADTSTDAAETDLGTAVNGAAAMTDLGTDDATADAGGAPAAVAEDAPASTEPETAAEPEAPADEAQPAEPPADAGVPAGWYADPSGRYELRYWDGAAWTEHVSRAGQQYTDPPVA